MPFAITSARPPRCTPLAWSDRILARGTQLTHFPQSGRHVPERPDPMLRGVLEGPYRVIYRVRPERVEVLAVVHARRLDIGKLDASE